MPGRQPEVLGNPGELPGIGCRGGDGPNQLRSARPVLEELDFYRRAAGIPKRLPLDEMRVAQRPIDVRHRREQLNVRRGQFEVAGHRRAVSADVRRGGGRSHVEERAVEIAVVRRTGATRGLEAIRTERVPTGTSARPPDQFPAVGVSWAVRMIGVPIAVPLPLRNVSTNRPSSGSASAAERMRPPKIAASPRPSKLAAENPAATRSIVCSADPAATVPGEILRAAVDKRVRRQRSPAHVYRPPRRPVFKRRIGEQVSRAGRRRHIEERRTRIDRRARRRWPFTNGDVR